MRSSNPETATDSSVPEYVAIIIGAGFSGLYALHNLRGEEGLDVLGRPNGTRYYGQLQEFAENGYEGYCFEPNR